MFLDLANASTHTNYLIQIVKEHLFSQNNSARQRSGSLAVISTTRQALFKINLSFFLALKLVQKLTSAALHAGPA
jgi:hypothetical protein